MSEELEKIWPSFEIKIRTLISELLEPSLAKFKATESMQVKLGKLSQEIKERVSDVESKLNTVNSRIPAVDPINRRVAEQTIRISSIETDFRSQVEGVKTHLDSLSSSLGNISSQVFSINKQNELFRKNLSDYAAGYSTLKKYIEDKISGIRAEVKHPFELQAEFNLRIEGTLRQIEKNFDSLSKEVAFVDFNTKKNQHDLRSGINLLETKNFEFDSSSNKIMDQMNSIRKVLKLNEIKCKSDIEESYGLILKDLQEFREEVSKSMDVRFVDMMDFVLIEPRYKKKLEELKKSKNISDKKEKVKKPQRPVLGMFKSSDNYQIPNHSPEPIEANPEKLQTGNIENIENIEKVQTSKSLDIQKSSNPEFDTCSNPSVSIYDQTDNYLIFEDLQAEQEKLSQQIQEILNMTEEKFTEHQHKFCIIKTLIIAVKHNIDNKLTLFKSSLEKELKSWISGLIESSHKQLENLFKVEEEKRSFEINRIQENSEELETILKQSSFEFSNFVANRKRENNDVKLDLKRIYAKLELITKDQNRVNDNFEKIRNSVKLVRDLIGMQVNGSKNDENLEDKKKIGQGKGQASSNKVIKFDMIERQEQVLEVLNNSIEKTAAVTQTSLTQRSFTPELPFLKRNK